MFGIFRRHLKVVVGAFIFLACAILITATVLIADFGKLNNEENEGNHDHPNAIIKPITFEEFIDNKFKRAERGFRGSWYSDNQILREDESNGDLILYNTEDQSNETLISKADLLGIHKDAFFVSSFKNKYLLIGYEKTPVYRHSSLAHYTIFEKSTKATYPIFVTQGKKLQYVSWNPKKPSIVFVFENNIYIREDLQRNENKQITTDGVPGIIYNGIPDWVYEEEILSTDNALYFSKQGNKVAFARFDDSQVENFFYSIYGPPSDPLNNQYPSNVMIKYPKAGTNNPKVELKVWDIETKKLSSVVPPLEVLAYSTYLYSAVTWITDNKISIIWMNRIQNNCIISECKATSNEKYECYVVDKELKESTGWVDLFQPPHYDLKGEAFIQIRPLPANAKKSLRFNQIYYFNSAKQSGEFLTSGNFAVVSILDWHKDLIHFIGTRENFPGKRHLYSVSLRKDVKCITCSSNCEYVVAIFPVRTEKNNPTKYVQKCSSPIKVPEVTLRNIHSHEVVAIFEDNTKLEKLMMNKSLPRRWDLMEPIGDGKRFNAPVSLLLPLNFDETKKYPTLVYVYGGPGSQEINYAWNSPAWPEYLVTSRNIIYMIIDGRGTGFQSVDYQFANYHALGTIEIEDQIQLTQSVQKKFPFMDTQRTGIWGWSYGGYVALMTLIRDKSNVFSCGISVAPPTDWLFYDSVYTERYMGLPSQNHNRKGYEKASILNSVEGLRNKTLFLNHGTADDNVHYQQSMMLIKEMELRNIDFQEATYPDENHGLGGVSRFLYHQMDKFLGKCFGYEV